MRASENGGPAGAASSSAGIQGSADSAASLFATAASASVAAATGSALPATVPIDVLLVIEMLARHKAPPANRRSLVRSKYVSLAAVEFDGETPPRRRTIYTRDANERGVGFVTQETLPVGRDGVLLVLTAAASLALPCTLVRFEKVLPGWYEGAFALKADEPRLSLPPSGA